MYVKEEDLQKPLSVKALEDDIKRTFELHKEEQLSTEKATDKIMHYLAVVYIKGKE